MLLVEKIIRSFNYIAELALIAIIVGMIIGLCKTIKSKDKKKTLIMIKASLKWGLGFILVRSVVIYATLIYEYNIIQFDSLSFMNIIITILSLTGLVAVFGYGIMLIISSAKVLFSKNQLDAGCGDKQE